jgi:hypothetical protein
VLPAVRTTSIDLGMSQQALGQAVAVEPGRRGNGVGGASNISVEEAGTRLVGV